MANNRTITAANAIFVLSVRGLFDTPRQIQGFSADDVTAFDDVTNKEVSPGVDGRLSAGWVFNPVNQNITLQADSESNDLFETWAQIENQQREAFIASGSILLRATGKRYTMERGFLMSVSKMPSIRKTLQARRYSLTWQNVSPAPI